MSEARWPEVSRGARHAARRTLPAARALRDEHLKDMDGELLPYLLLADVARWTAARAEDESASAFASAKAIVGWLETEYDAAALTEQDLSGLGSWRDCHSFEWARALPLLGPSLTGVPNDLGLLEQRDS